MTDSDSTSRTKPRQMLNPTEIATTTITTRSNTVIGSGASRLESQVGVGGGDFKNGLGIDWLGAFSPAGRRPTRR